MRKTILFVHQSADLYGSDRVLLSLVKNLDREKFYPIVLLPDEGPLVDELKLVGAECYVLPITKLSSATLSLRGLLGLPISLVQSIRAFNRILKGREVDLVHSNTLAILSGAVWAQWSKVPHVWHVHEIIVRPVTVRKIYAKLLSWFADQVVCNSFATKTNLIQDIPSLNSKTQVVWNGLVRESKVDLNAVHRYRNQLGLTDSGVVVTLVGRINRWKGQSVLVEAATLLWNQGVRNIHFVIVGSAPTGQEHFLNSLQNSINESPAKNSFTIQEFTPDVWLVWDACDIAVIPSIEPEPFGMVALEAMVAAKPVISTNYGGLVEIVVEGETGLLVAPGDALALATGIRKLVDDKRVRLEMGRNGVLRHHKFFTLTSYVKNMEAVYQSLQKT